MSRVNRLAHVLVREAALEGFDIHKDPRMEDMHEEGMVNPRYDPSASNEYYKALNKQRKKHYRVVMLEKTKQKLEKWFLDRDIPIRVVYGEPDQVHAIPQSGMITYQYQLIGNQDPPTAWMIVHNLSHAIFDKGYNTGAGRGNPHLYQTEHSSLVEEMFEMIGEMGLSSNKAEKLGPERHTQIFPTTRSEQIGKINSSVEAFHELFTQWVVTGHVKLNGPDPATAQQWENKLETLFRQTVDEMARVGTVLTNLY